MKVVEITENIIPVWGRSKGKVVRKYRCTTGARKGRIVAKPSTCTAVKKIGSMLSMKKARRQRSAVSQVKASRRKRAGVASQRIASLNKPLSQRRYGKATAHRQSLSKKKGYKPPSTRVSRKAVKTGPGVKRRKPTRKKIK